MTSLQSEYMAEPPEGQGRFDAGTITTGALALGGTLTSLSLIFVGLRVFTRLSIVKRSLGADDYLIIISLALSIAFYGLFIDMCNLGLGVHMWQVKLANYSKLYAHGMVIMAIYCLSVTSAKMSLLVLYLRLSPDRLFRIVVISLIAFTTAYGLAYPFLIILGCRPIEASWNPALMRGAKCIDKQAIYYALSITNILMDVVCLILPLKIIIPLQMGTRQKWSLIALFATGGFVCICAIRRTALLPDMFTSTDYTFDIEKQLNWACIEVNAGIICASVPALKPFFVRYLPMFIHSHLTGSARKSAATGGPNGAGASASHRNYQTSAPYSTTVENNKRRRNVQSEAYELHSHDDLSLSSSNEMPSKPGGGGGAGSEDDDVAKLWSGNAFRRDRGQGGHRQTIIESTPRDTDGSSLGSLEDIRSAAADGLALPARMASVRASGGITVTTETKVVYERS
ncbi:integral membrane protein [Colletotrichum musicola]|uniref:Integral membrane protein n=1 Tax=Colletotrichum musicola TaxID=2175873 RepID=A0A8H6KF79_9PEZI|nr:integral membrane protein [Colletotrichum musicola]